MVPFVWFEGWIYCLFTVVVVVVVCGAHVDTLLILNAKQLMKCAMTMLYTVRDSRTQNCTFFAGCFLAVLNWMDAMRLWKRNRNPDTQTTSNLSSGAFSASKKTRISLKPYFYFIKLSRKCDIHWQDERKKKSAGRYITTIFTKIPFFSKYFLNLSQE